MYKIAYFAVVLAFMSSPLHALVEHAINEKQPLSIAFSKSSHNRISIQNGSVEKVFGNDAHFNITIDPATGNAFVNVLHDLLEPTTLTIVTHAGFIQDLIVSSGDKTSEHLILQEKDDMEDLISTTIQIHNPTVEFLNKILEGKIPLGYGQRPLQETDRVSLPAPLKTTPIEAFEGPFEHVVVYKIKNEGKDRVVISPDSLKKDPISWVFLNGHELNAKEEVVCILSYPKKED